MNSFSSSPRLPLAEPYDYVLLTDRLRGYAAVRDRISRLLAHGEIVRVKKGLYLPGAAEGRAGVDPLVLSGMVSGPSCISFEKALELHGWIPERVEEITCATTGRQRRFETPVGRFSYHPVPVAVFSAEVERREAAGGAYFLATPERALCDLAGRTSGLRRWQEMGPWLMEDLRISPETPGMLSAATLAALAVLSRRRPAALLARWAQRRGLSSQSYPADAVLP